MEEVSKPAVIQEYNNYMGGVDKGYQLVRYYPFSYRSQMVERSFSSFGGDSTCECISCIVCQTVLIRGLTIYSFGKP